MNGSVAAYQSMAQMNGYDENKQRSAIQEYMKNGGVNLDPAVTAWCAGIVNAALAQQGIKGTGKLNARSFMEWGQGVDEPAKGDIAVFSRGDPNGWQGHVGFFDGYGDDGSIRVLGGNQSNAVNVSSYPADRLLGFRRPGENPAAVQNGPHAPQNTRAAVQSLSTRNSPQTEASPMEEEKIGGLLGSLFPNMSADRADRIRLGVSGLSMNPNEGLQRSIQQRMGERREDRKEAKGQAAAQQQANRTLQWLQTQAQNNPNAAQALQMLSQGVIDAKGAVQMAMQQPEARYQQVTGQTAATMGLDPSKVYNLGPDGKVSGIGAGDTNVNVSSGSEVGTIPPGYELITDPQTGGRRLAPIPGGPVDVEQRQAAAAEEQAGQVQDEKAATQGNVVLNQVSAIRKMLDQGGMFDMPETGIVGSGLAKLGLNQEAVDMRNRLTTLQGMVSFDQLAKMRAASPTGGALGGIAIRELELLQSQLGSLDQSSSPEIIRETLDLLESVMRKAEAYPNAAEYGFGGSQLSGPSSGSGPNGTLSDEELLKKYGYTD